MKDYVKEINRLRDQQDDLRPIDTEDKKTEWRMIQAEIDQIKKNQTIHNAQAMRHLDRFGY